MKKRSIKNLSMNKKTIATFSFSNKLKGGNRSHTSCLCMDTECECKVDVPFR
ncbi:hypothetical protein [Kordia zhangzhouensis]|uniref:hypothetical protein n=1 Tax=Kordia zhangzhouensis TaxID=1620405 RepID=UPI0012F95DCB|nr:hypothetical protein [Kordia zhangzhouensis]